MRVWLSGGANGLGLHLAESLLDAGCTRLAIVDIVPQDQGDELITRLRRSSTQYGKYNDIKVLYYLVDVRDAQAVEQSMQDAASQLDGLNIVINNAGVVNESDLDHTMSVNTIALIRATEAAFRVFKAQSEVRLRTVLNVASAAGLFPLPFAKYYAASKHAVVGYSRSIAKTAMRSNIRVLCLCPGWIDAGMGTRAATTGIAHKHDGVGIMKAEDAMPFFIDLLRSDNCAGEVFHLSDQAGISTASTKLCPSRMSKI